MTPDVSKRARAWRDAVHAQICDVLEPWEHGTVVRATRYPTYYDYNVVRVEQDPQMSPEALERFANLALAGLDHRKLDFDVVDAAESVRPAFEAKGWKVTRLIWMRHNGELPPGPEISVGEVPYEAVLDLQAAWHDEDFPGVHPAGHYEEAREVAARLATQVLATTEDGRAVAFAELTRASDGAEITSVFVHPDYRGAGRGTAVTRAAIEGAGDVRDLWIVADADGRAKDVYAGLGFRPAWEAMEFLRLPQPRS